MPKLGQRGPQTEPRDLVREFDTAEVRRMARLGVSKGFAVKRAGGTHRLHQRLERVGGGDTSRTGPAFRLRLSESDGQCLGDADLSSACEYQVGHRHRGHPGFPAAPGPVRLRARLFGAEAART